MNEHPEIWVNAAAAAALAALVAYAVLGGADFGGGVWDLFSFGPRKEAQREAIREAMGPVWEANHVWLIFVIVLLFTCFPPAFSALAVVLFLPFHLALLGIMLRGAAFVFRAYEGAIGAPKRGSAWGVVFGTASLITPFLLGAAFGVLTKGGVHELANRPADSASPAFLWLTPYCVANGFLALATCSFLAAVYLTNETTGELREDFRRRAIVAGTATAALAGIVLVLAGLEAPWFLRRMTQWRALPFVAAGLVCFAGSAWSVYQRRWRLSRAFAIAEIVLLLAGWGWAQYPYLIYPDFEMTSSAASTPMLQFMVLSLVPGAAILLPSLWFLFRVFKGSEVQRSATRR